MTDAAPVHGAPVAGATPTTAPVGPLLSETITTTTTTTITERKFAPLPAPDPKRPKTLFGYFGGLQSGPSTSGAEAVPVVGEDASLALKATPLKRGCAREKNQVFLCKKGLYRRWDGRAMQLLCQPCALVGKATHSNYPEVEGGPKNRLCADCARVNGTHSVQNPCRHCRHEGRDDVSAHHPEVEGGPPRLCADCAKTNGTYTIENPCRHCRRDGRDDVSAIYPEVKDGPPRLCADCATVNGTYKIRNPCVHCERYGRENVSAAFPEEEGGPPRLCADCSMTHGTYVVSNPCRHCRRDGRDDVRAHYPEEENGPPRLCADCARVNQTHSIPNPCVQCHRDGRDGISANYPEITGGPDRLCADCAVTAGTHVDTGATGGSYEACRFFCRLSQALGVHFPHIHYIPGGGHEGREKRGLLPRHPKMTPDSFRPDPSGESKGFVYQYHGRVAHGVLPSHPQHDTYWSSLGKGTDLYARTLEKDQRYVDAGYRLFQIWGHEFTEECERKRAPRDVREVCREWFGK